MSFSEEQYARFENIIKKHLRKYDKNESDDSLPDPEDYDPEVI